MKQTLQLGLGAIVVYWVICWLVVRVLEATGG